MGRRCCRAGNGMPDSSSSTYVVGGDDAGGVVPDELELHAEPPEQVLLLRLEPNACKDQSIGEKLG